MSDLMNFNRRLHQVVAAQVRETRWDARDAQLYMADQAVRRGEFEHLASQLISGVVEPRMEMLAGYFPQAKLADDDPLGHRSCWFGYCERFPVTAHVLFSVEHDVKWQRAYLRYEAYMMPLFVNLNGHDQMEFSLQEPDEEQAGPWVEDRLLEFLDGYLQIDRGPADAEDELVTDPVCGMRLQRSEATASFIFRGHPYFFCSEACQSRFVESPHDFIQFKTP